MDINLIIHQVYLHSFETSTDTIDTQNRSSNLIRDIFANYFLTDKGNVEWQDRMIHYICFLPSILL